MVNYARTVVQDHNQLVFQQRISVNPRTVHTKVENTVGRALPDWLKEKKLSNWSEIYLGQLKLDPDFKLVIPIDPLPGENEEDTMIRYFLQKGVFVIRDNGTYGTNSERAKELDINIYKLVKAFEAAEFADTMEVLEQDGYVHLTLDSADNIQYALTPEGARYLEELKTKDN
jgi:hypothetical protein